MKKTEVWKALLIQHAKLRCQAGVSIYTRITLLVRVYEDPYFTPAMQAEKMSPTDLLNKEVSDTCANFTELLQMLKMFPQRKQWEGGNLNEMRLKMLEMLRAKQNGEKEKRKAKDGDKIVKRSATLAEVRDLKEENERLKEQLKSAQQIINSLELQLETARETIGSLNETVSLFRLREVGHQKQLKSKKEKASA